MAQLDLGTIPRGLTVHVTTQTRLKTGNLLPPNVKFGVWMDFNPRDSQLSMDAIDSRWTRLGLRLFYLPFVEGSIDISKFKINGEDRIDLMVQEGTLVTARVGSEAVLVLSGLEAEIELMTGGRVDFSDGKLEIALKSSKGSCLGNATTAAGNRVHYVTLLESKGGYLLSSGSSVWPASNSQQVYLRLPSSAVTETATLASLGLAGIA